MMNLTPTEQERLIIFQAAEFARRHRALGVKLSHPEAVALIADEMLLAGQRVLPAALLAHGFEFSHTEVGPALRAVLN